MNKPIIPPLKSALFPLFKEGDGISEVLSIKRFEILLAFARNLLSPNPNDHQLQYQRRNS